MEWGGSVLLLMTTGVVLGLALPYLCYTLWARSEILRRRLRSQGIAGPTPSLIYGNISEMRQIIEEEKKKRKEEGEEVCVTADYSEVLFPYFLHWRKKYGSIFMYSTGNIHIMLVSDPGVVKELSLYKSLYLGKPSYLQKERGALLGKGILASNGALWAHERKVIAPEFFMDKLKGMIDLIVEATIILSEKWGSAVDSAGGSAQIVIDDDLRRFSADVISKACFGSNLDEGKEIFFRLRQLQKAMAKSGLFIRIPWLRYLPTKTSLEIWRLNKEIRNLILNIVKKRKDGVLVATRNDLLESIVGAANAGNADLLDPESFIVDNCKNIYFAGHETTAVTATWCLLLLASYPKWQDLVRQEILEGFQGALPDFNMLRKLKKLTMVIQETLRLYPPVAFVTRAALQDLELGTIKVPKGMGISLVPALLHRDPENWGDGVNEFNPDRFSNGIAAACKFPQNYIPFGIGTRTCAGQNLAMLELKIMLSLLLSRFAFAVSPSYHHSPAFRLTIEPEFGVTLVETTWLPLWLQPHQLPFCGDRAKDERSLLMLGNSKTTDLDGSMTNGHNLQYYKENMNNKTCHLHLSGDDQTPSTSTPFTKTAVCFHLHFSSEASERVPDLLSEKNLARKDDEDEASLVNPVEETLPIQKDTSDFPEVEAQSTSQLVTLAHIENDDNNEALLIDHVPETPCILKESSSPHIVEPGEIAQVMPSADCDLRTSKEMGQRQQKDFDYGNLNETDINDAVELSIAASEAMVISEMVTRSESECLNAPTVLEIALRVKKARYSCHFDQEFIPNSISEVSENDCLSDLDDDMMADAFDDVGLCVTQGDNSPITSQSKFFLKYYGSDREMHQVEKPSSPENGNIKIPDRPSGHMGERFHHEVENGDPNDDAFTTDLQNLPTSPPPLLKIRPSCVPLGSDILHSANLSISQVEKVTSFTAALEAQMHPQRMYQDGNHAIKGEIIRKSIKGLFLAETSFISESLDVMNEYQSEWRPQGEAEIIASSNASCIPVCIYKENEKILEEETFQHDLLRYSSLSVLDPLCSVVPCSILSDDVPTNQNFSQSKAREHAEKLISSSFIQEQICRGSLNIQMASSSRNLHQPTDYDLSPCDAKSLCMPARRCLKSLKSYSILPRMPTLHPNEKMIFGDTAVPSFGFAKNIMNLCAAERCNKISVSSEVEPLAFNKDVHSCTEVASPFPCSDNDVVMLDQQEKRPLSPLNARKHRCWPCRKIIHNECEKGSAERGLASNLHPNTSGTKRVRFDMNDNIGTTLEPKFCVQSSRRSFKKLKGFGSSCNYITRNKRGRDMINCTTKKQGLLLYGLEFLLTGFSSQKEKELEELIRQNGGYILQKVPALSKGLRRSGAMKATNRKPPVILSPKKVPTTKFLYGCAINALTLEASWVTDSIQAGMVFPPLKYLIRPTKSIPSNFLQLEEILCCQDHSLIFEKVGVMLYGKVNFCKKFCKIIKYGGGQVFESLQRLEQSLDTGKNKAGFILVENEPTISRHLKHCALEYKLQIVPISWIISSLFSGELLPIKKERCAPLYRIKMPTFHLDQAAYMSQEI